jgi:hypothetical protein
MARVMADGTATARGLVPAVAAATGRAEPEVRTWASASGLLGATAMVDEVVRRVEKARAGEAVDVD